MSVGGWRRVSRANPCPICERPDWCTVTADGSAVCCMRIESPKRLRCGGWLHRLHDDEGTRKGRRIRRVTLRACPEPEPVADFGQLAERYAAAVNADALARFARELGVSVNALRRLRVGWDGAAWTFPMVNAAGVVTGIRRRLPDGRKLSVQGGREGLFVPIALPADGLLLITEGPTDCAALLTLGFAAIGRPSCTGGVKLCCDFARGRGTVIVADGDEPGQFGAEALAMVLRLYCPSVQVICPSSAKDARDWLRRGGTRADVQAAIDAAKPIQLGIKTRAASR